MTRTARNAAASVVLAVLVTLGAAAIVEARQAHDLTAPSGGAATVPVLPPAP